MNDLTLLYYTAHMLPDGCSERIREHLLETANGLPIVSVSQKPIDLGKNICVGKIGQSYYNCYKQIYTGACEVKTKYISCCEDDTLYNQEHFLFRPEKDAFYYNKSMWYLEDDRFWHKGQTGMFGCIVPTELLVKSLKKRFDEYPKEPFPRNKQVRAKWIEPGRCDGEKTEDFRTKIPLITLNYFSGLGGRAKSIVHKPVEESDIEYWGSARALKDKFWHGKD